MFWGHQELLTRRVGSGTSCCFLVDVPLIQDRCHFVKLMSCNVCISPISMNKAIGAFSDVLQLYREIKRAFTPTAWRTWDARVGSFFDPERTTLLNNMPGISVSTASRHLNAVVPLEQCQHHLLRFQIEELRKHACQILEPP